MKNLLEIKMLMFILEIACFNFVSSAYYNIYKNMDLPSLVPTFTFEVLDESLCTTIAARYCPYGIIDFTTGTPIGIGAFSVQKNNAKFLCKLYQQTNSLSSATFSSDTNLYLRQEMVNSTQIKRCLGTDQQEYVTWDMDYLAQLKNVTNSARLLFSNTYLYQFGTGLNCKYSKYASFNTTLDTDCLIKCRDDFNCKVVIFGVESLGSNNCFLLNNTIDSTVLQAGQICYDPFVWTNAFLFPFVSSVFQITYQISQSSPVLNLCDENIAIFF